MSETLEQTETTDGGCNVRSSDHRSHGGEVMDTYTFNYEGEIVTVPKSLLRDKYRKRRRLGWTHEEAIGLRKPGTSPGSKRRPPGHVFRRWKARPGHETPDQLAALKKYGGK